MDNVVGGARELFGLVEWEVGFNVCVMCSI